MKIEIQIPPTVNVGDMVMTNMFGMENHLGLIIGVKNRFYWVDYDVLLPSGRTAVLSRSSILSCEEFDEL